MIKISSLIERKCNDLIESALIFRVYVRNCGLCTDWDIKKITHREQIELETKQQQGEKRKTQILLTLMQIRRWYLHVICLLADDIFMVLCVSKRNVSNKCCNTSKFLSWMTLTPRTKRKETKKKTHTREHKLLLLSNRSVDVWNLHCCVWM